MFADTPLTHKAPVRKHSTPSIKVKMEILNRLDNGEKQAELAREYNLGRSTVYDIKQKRSQILSFAEQIKSRIVKRKNLTIGRNSMLESALYAWYISEEDKGESLSDRDVRSKALELNRLFKEKDTFRASDSWLANFKARFGIF